MSRGHRTARRTGPVRRLGRTASRFPCATSRRSCSRRRCATSTCSSASAPSAPTRTGRTAARPADGGTVRRLLAGRTTRAARRRGRTSAATSLERMLPGLAIADRLTLDERYLAVRGDLRTYRIHLGSGQHLMEPSDTYLCIVPRAAARPPRSSCRSTTTRRCRSSCRRRSCWRRTRRSRTRRSSSSSKPFGRLGARGRGGQPAPRSPGSPRRAARPARLLG